MKRSIKSSRVNGSIFAPASKSVAQRAIAIASMAVGQSEIASTGSSDDVIAAISVCKALGARIETKPDGLIISGGISRPAIPLNFGESGLSVRMFSAIAATLEGEVVLTGHGSLLNRPMNIVENSLSPLCEYCRTNNGKLPILVKGPFKGGEVTIDGSISSQVLTGILMASPYAKKDVTVKVENLQSRPYIDITIGIMKYFGVDVENMDYQEFKIKSGQFYQPKKYTVEGDWSGAAFMLVAGAVAGKVKVENLQLNSSQADKAIINALIYAGAKVSMADNFVEVCKHQLNGFHFDATHCPDLFPPLVALASHCEGETRILGVSRLRVKESDRAATLSEEFIKMGVDIRIDGELMVINGGKPHGAIVQSHGDHRIAMATAIAALAGDGDVEIEGAEAVAKSYPEFFEDLEKLTI
ncbi:MAG: 3-phosphoshikimate 1-carboxyvinyltransferase [Bacteroidales bacterium]|nr:MAG: 3-phosphoshikimate 1-carboxyvinyltransferase [Bacteroidales bacterium]